MPRIKLSEKAIERIPLSPNTIEYYDTKLTGFGVRTGTSSKIYFVKGKTGDRQFKRKIGRVGLLSFEEARQKAVQILKDAEQGIDPDVVKTTPDQITLRATLKMYFETRKTLKPSTKDMYKMELDRYLPDWLDLPMQSISSAMVVGKHAEIGIKSKAMADCTFRIVRALYNFAMDMHEETITRNPVKRLSSVKAWYKVPRKTSFIKPSMLPVFFDAIRKQPGLVSDYLEALLFTGIRSASEIAKLQINHVDLKEKSITLYDTKTQKELQIPVCASTLVILKRRIADAKHHKTPYLFYSFSSKTSASGHITDVRISIKQITGGTELDYITPHDLRRSFITYADELDISKVVQKRLVGHAIPTDVTDGYIILTMDRLRSAVNKIEEFILQYSQAPAATR